MAEELVIKIGGNTEKFDKALGDVHKSAGNLEDKLANVAKVSAIAFAALTAQGVLAIKAWREQEVATNELNQSLVNQGVYSKALSDSYQQMATELQRVTTFGDEAIVSAQAQLQTYLGQIPVTKALTKAVLDYATAQKIDAASAAERLGKAIGTNTNVLARDGVVVDAAATKQEKLKQVLEGVERKWGGQAEAAAQGLGVLDQMKNSVGELSEALGERLSPVVIAVAKSIKSLSENTVISHQIIEGFVQIFGFLVKAADTALMTIQNFGISIGAIFGTMAVAIDQAVHGQLKAAWQSITDGSKAANDEVEANRVAHAERMAAIDEALLGKTQDNQQREAEMVRQSKENLVQIERDSTASEDAERAARFQAILAQDKEFQNLSSTEQRKYLEKNKSQLVLAMDTEQSARAKAATKTLQQEIKFQNQYLEDQQKFGTSYAIIKQNTNRFVNNDAANASSELVQLQQSENNTLKDIGKAAAVVDITMRTATSAMRVYEGFSTIPFIGPALGVAAAAAVIAFGAEQIGKVTGLAEGGLALGGIPGRDSIPAMLQHGELVAPTSNFEEVIGSVRAKREAEKLGGDNLGAGSLGLEISFVGDADRYFEAKIIERQRLGISLIPRFT